ncbi:MAG: flavodoxin [Anaerobiospirillum sp.]|nr:flavodoxin [Anaerobiospirillum sp.]
MRWTKVMGAALAAQLSVAAAAAELNDGLVLLSGGTVTIGSPDSERQRQADETQHQVTLSAFYVDPHEVTQQDYQAVMGTNPSHFRGNNLPVEQVTWYDAINYCNKLSEAQGLTPVYQIDGTTVTWNRAADGYRLLTEAEWEYAARAGTQSVFYEGGQIVADQVNFCGSYPYLIEENYLSHQNPEVVTSTYRQETMPVDGLAPNSWGLYHMEGNVSEWCFDYYGQYAAGDNPSGPTSGSLRVNRGGGWNDFAKHVRMAYRSVTSPDTVEQNLGFRIARNAEPGTGSVVTTYSLDIKTPAQPKVLVAYFSYTGNTEQGAQLMAEALGADLFTIEMEHPYRGNIYDVSQRDLNQDARPALATHVANMDQYDVVLVGYPTWWGTMPMPMFTFLNEYDFSGKTLLSFSSHGSTRFGDSISDFSKQVPGAYVGQAFEYYYSGGSELEAEIAAWLKESGFKPKE